MDQPRLSPTQFSKLPEDLKAKVLHGAGFGTMTQQHRQSAAIIQERIEDAGTKPFSAEEVWELLILGIPILVFYVNTDYKSGLMVRYDAPRKESDKGNLQLLRLRTLLYRIVYKQRLEIVKYTKLGSNINISIKPETRIHRMLKDRLDSSIIMDNPKEPIGFNEPFMMGKYGKPIPIFSNTIFTDLRSIFFVFYRRFNIIIPNRALELTRQYTLEVLDNIIDNFAPANPDGSLASGENLPILWAYLTENCILFDMDVERIITNQVNISQEYFDILEEKCKILYELLSDYINKLEL